MDVPDVGSRRRRVGLAGGVAVDEVAAKKVPVELEERQEVVPEVLRVLVLHVQLLRRVEVNNVEILEIRTQLFDTQV